jgi:hypothetical protein
MTALLRPPKPIICLKLRGRLRVFHCTPAAPLLAHCPTLMERSTAVSFRANALRPPTLTLTLILLTWRIGWAPNNASKWQMGFNLVFKGLKQPPPPPDPTKYVKQDCPPFSDIYKYINLIYKDTCLFVPYTNPHFWTDRNQTLHTSPPWSGRDRGVCMGPQYFTFPTFLAYFVGSRCQFLRSSWLPAPHYPATALY